MIKVLFFALIVKPLVVIVLGMNVYGKENLPKRGPALLAANHNSHLDVLVLMSLYPLKLINRVRPVAASDYFFKNKFLKWVAIHCIGIIPLDRGEKNIEAVFALIHGALDQGDIVILFPEGSRGQPESVGKIKKGLYYIAKEREDSAIVPIFMQGLGKALPRGVTLLVPFNCDVIIGQAFNGFTDAADFAKQLAAQFLDLQQYCITSSRQDD